MMSEVFKHSKTASRILLKLSILELAYVRQTQQR